MNLFNRKSNNVRKLEEENLTEGAEKLMGIVE